ncbi:hypothetical protein BJF93_08625 [Xaviernesmea oryzae]|uniref:HutD family protein n=1 Tax=Xaviernesmea oryzae TaxID=464029 RepID=A0A1Q9B108_9HYPH|nr:HutD family protein [Xaviernesmea oryzae]OLP61657.1 hypothetical protein BJF93_08625 [Xaviernesmea oryzae]SEL04048.1 hypothetical protein SAMN04487976_105199 [Xaviernesmea oryzae]
MRLLPARHHRRMPWKNGGGETREIAISPGATTLVDFDWRLSMAHVASDGPFSLFPGIERTLCILNGAGIRLTPSGEETRLVTLTSPPFTFSAEIPVAAELVDGPILDLNVMTRLSAWRHEVTPIQAGEDISLQPCDAAFLVCRAGALTARAGGETVEIVSEDAVDLTSTADLRLDGSGDGFLVRLLR